MTFDLPPPRHCRPRAYYGLAEVRPDLDTTAGLLQAACCVAAHALEPAHCDADDAARRLRAWGARVQERAPSASRRARLAHLHSVLFDEEKFSGNQADYYAPENSFVPSVLETRRGIPISLALVYKVVADGIGLATEGIGAPGHFLLRVRDEDGPLLLDPFHRGRILDREEAFVLMETTLGHEVPREDRFLRPVSHTEWITRILRNLEAIYARRAHPRDAAAMVEMRHLVEAG